MFARSAQAAGSLKAEQGLWIARLFRFGVKDAISAESEKVTLWFIFWTFIKIGSVAFGGFMSLISFIESIVVKRHKLIRHEEMLDAISLANLLPGPQAVNVVAFGPGNRLARDIASSISSCLISL